MTALSPDQKIGLHQILDWYTKHSKEKQYITLGGYAGTGKTTLIAVLRKKLNKIDNKLRVGFASYTGKATRVLGTKLHEAKINLKKDSVSTIHSLIYSPIINERQEITGWKRKEKIDRDIIIIDEGSMIDETIWHHLLAYKIPIVVVGDHGQLPPVTGTFNLMEKPDVKLQEIHRQAAKNPIIALSKQARTHGFIKPGDYSDTVKKIDMQISDNGDALQEMLYNFRIDTLVLCGYNRTRIRFNLMIRGILGFETAYPTQGDRVICLRNNQKARIYNGMLGTIVMIEKQDDDWYHAEIMMDGEDKKYRGLISVGQFNNTPLNFTDRRRYIMKGDLFDFGYALTVHKAQGSQAKRVILFEERFKRMTQEQWNRWLYTAVTRAEEELYIFSGS